MNMLQFRLSLFFIVSSSTVQGRMRRGFRMYSDLITAKAYISIVF